MSKTLSDQYLEAGEKHADLEAAASILEETKSAVLSQMMTTHTSTGAAVNKAEMLVKASPAWMRHLEKMVAARTAANKAKVYLKYLEMKTFEQHSRDATERLVARI